LFYGLLFFRITTKAFKQFFDILYRFFDLDFGDFDLDSLSSKASIRVAKASIHGLSDFDLDGLSTKASIRVAKASIRVAKASI